jgi:hypothetical protein
VGGGTREETEVREETNDRRVRRERTVMLTCACDIDPCVLYNRALLERICTSCFASTFAVLHNDEKKKKNVKEKKPERAKRTRTHISLCRELFDLGDDTFLLHFKVSDFTVEAALLACDFALLFANDLFCRFLKRKGKKI